MNRVFSKNSLEFWTNEVLPGLNKRYSGWAVTKIERKGQPNLKHEAVFVYSLAKRIASLGFFCKSPSPPLAPPSHYFSFSLASLSVLPSSPLFPPSRPPPSSLLPPPSSLLPPPSSCSSFSSRIQIIQVRSRSDEPTRQVHTTERSLCHR
jgi:hypothetical protein